MMSVEHDHRAHPLPNHHLDYLINGHDIQKVLGIVRVTTSDDFLVVRQPDGSGMKYLTFVDVKRATGIKKWVTPKYKHAVGDWFPVEYREQIEAFPFGDGLKKYPCIEGEPCEVFVYGEWHGSMCGRPATGRAPKGMRRAGDVPACNLHRAAAKRRADNDERRRQQSAQRREEREHERALTQASADWAKRLGEEFGIEAEGMHCEEHLRVQVGPEKLYAKLVDIYGMLRDAGYNPDEVG